MPIAKNKPKKQRSGMHGKQNSLDCYFRFGETTSTGKTTGKTSHLSATNRLQDPDAAVIVLSDSDTPECDEQLPKSRCESRLDTRKLLTSKHSLKSSAEPGSAQLLLDSTAPAEDDDDPIYDSPSSSYRNSCSESGDEVDVAVVNGWGANVDHGACSSSHSGDDSGVCMVDDEVPWLPIVAPEQTHIAGEAGVHSKKQSTLCPLNLLNSNSVKYDTKLATQQTTLNKFFGGKQPERQKFMKTNDGGKRKRGYAGVWGAQVSYSQSAGTSDVPKATSSGTLSHDQVPYKPRKPPSYKRLAGTDYVVDGFNFGYIEGVTRYFLSHFHYDHYVGLSRKFEKPIYCSQITANLVLQNLRIAKKWVNVLPMNEPVALPEGVEVTCIDANHCPGSVMFVFQLPSGENILHTGDFRAEDSVLQDPVLKRTPIDTVYLDTTYMEPRYVFPSQECVISKVMDYLDKRLSLPDGAATMVVVGSYTIGKERVFQAIGEHFDCKIGVEWTKFRTLRCLEDEKLFSRLIPFDEAFLRVVNMKTVRSINELKLHLSNHSGFSSIIGVCPSGWEFMKTGSKGLEVTQKGNVSLVGVPYSEHSSFEELHRFVLAVKPKKIIPTVYGGGGQHVKEMFKTLDLWKMEAKTHRAENL